MDAIETNGPFRLTFFLDTWAQVDVFEPSCYPPCNIFGFNGDLSKVPLPFSAPIIANDVAHEDLLRLEKENVFEIKSFSDGNVFSYWTENGTLWQEDVTGEKFPMGEGYITLHHNTEHVFAKIHLSTLDPLIERLERRINEFR